MPPKKKMVLVSLARPGYSMPGPSRRKRIALTIFGPLLGAIGFVVVTIFKIFSGPLNRRSRERFAQELRTLVPFLFNEHAAQIVPNVGVSRNLEDSCVTVAADHLRFRFIRKMGDFSVFVGSEFAPGRFEELDLIVAAAGGSLSEAERRDCLELRKIDGVLRRWLEQVKEALAPGRAKATLDAAIDINNERADRYLAEMQAKGLNAKVVEL